MNQLEGFDHDNEYAWLPKDEKHGKTE